MPVIRAQNLSCHSLKREVAMVRNTIIVWQHKRQFRDVVSLLLLWAFYTLAAAGSWFLGSLGSLLGLLALAVPGNQSLLLQAFGLPQTKQIHKVVPLNRCKTPFGERISKLLFSVDIFQINVFVFLQSLKDPINVNSLCFCDVPHVLGPTLVQHFNYPLIILHHH